MIRFIRVTCCVIIVNSFKYVINHVKMEQWCLHLGEYSFWSNPLCFMSELILEILCGIYPGIFVSAMANKLESHPSAFYLQAGKITDIMLQLWNSLFWTTSIFYALLHGAPPPKKATHKHTSRASTIQKWLFFLRGIEA